MSGKIARLAVANMEKMNTKPVQYNKSKGFMGNKPNKDTEDNSPASRVLKYTMMLREQRKQLKGDNI